MKKLFSKSLTKTDITTRLTVPTKILQHIQFSEGDHSVELRVKYRTEDVRIFRCWTRRNVYRKPVFSKGWLDFVRAKGLKIDDIVIFYQEDDDATQTQYKIEVKKKIRLMGQDIWGDAEE